MDDDVKRREAAEALENAKTPAQRGLERRALLFKKKFKDEQFENGVKNYKRDPLLNVSLSDPAGYRCIVKDLQSEIVLHTDHDTACVGGVCKPSDKMKNKKFAKKEADGENQKGLNPGVYLYIEYECISDAGFAAMDRSLYSQEAPVVYWQT